MTYLQIVNNVLTRLRETSVVSVSTNAYSLLIGKFVNDSKRQVEDAWGWNALSQTLSLTTTGSASTLVVTGSGMRPRDETINDITNKVQLQKAPLQWIIDRQQLSTATNGVPCYYAWNGNNGIDNKIELYPTPNGSYSYKVNLYVPQVTLSADADVLLIPSEAVEMGAYARALVERGEDGGLSSSEAYGLFKGILADQIALEATRFIENDCWSAV